MKHYTIIISLLLTLFISCNNRNENISKYSLRDSVTKEHLQLIDSSEYVDTADINYKLLKAYLANDTAFFSKLHLDIARKNELKERFKNNDSCIHQKSLQELNADKAYRFVYTAAFCQYKLNVTISKSGDSSNIHFIKLQDVWLNGECKIINEFNKKITLKDWDEFCQLMRSADFWGLKSTNDTRVTDASTLITTGFEQGYRNFEGKPRFHYVYRYGVTTLADPFTFVLKLSGNKTGCP